MIEVGKEITKKELKELLSRATKIERYYNSVRSGYVAYFKEPIVFPDGAVYRKLSISDSPDYKGFIYIDGVRYNRINTRDAFIQVGGIKDVNEFFGNINR